MAQARRRIAVALERLDSGRAIVSLAQAGRRRLPGDERYGDPLSVSGEDAPQFLGRSIAALAHERPSALREVGLSALQVWQVLSEAQGRGHGDREVTILFTDLVEFSSWTLEAGDAAALDLLRQVGLAVEGPVTAHGGRVVKRLGDGVMAVFDGEPGAAVEAARARSPSRAPSATGWTRSGSTSSGAGASAPRARRGVSSSTSPRSSKAPTATPRPTTARRGRRSRASAARTPRWARARA